MPQVPTKFKSRFFNKHTEYNGVKYDSKLEAKWAEILDQRLAAGDLKSIRRQVPIKLFVNQVMICKMIVDFCVVNRDGSEEWIEVKGCPTPAWRLKRKLLEALYPNLKYTVVGPRPT